MTWVPLLLLAGVLVSAMVVDLASRRIPNKLIAIGLAVALVWHVTGPVGNWTFDPRNPGAAGAVGWLLGGALLFAAFLPFHVLRIMGAGDVKLMTVVGAFFGARPGALSQLVGVALWILVAGGVLGVVRMIATRTSARVVSNIAALIAGHAARITGRACPRFDPRTGSADRMPYALAIAGGVFFYLAGLWTGWIRIP